MTVRNTGRAAAIAAAGIALGATTPAMSSTMLFTTYSGGSLVDGRMQGGTLNGIAAIDTASASYRVTPEYVLARGFLFSQSMDVQTTVQFNNWYNGGGIAGVVTGAYPAPRLPQGTLEQQQIWSGDTVYTGSRNDIALTAGQHVMYGEDGRVSGYIDVADISNRSVRFMGFQGAGIGKGGFLVETTADGRPIDFTSQADGITISGHGFVRAPNSEARPLSEIRLLNADFDPDKPVSIEKDAIVFGDYRVGSIQRFQGPNTDPLLFPAGADLTDPDHPLLKGSAGSVGYVRNGSRYAYFPNGVLFDIELSAGAGAAAVPEPSTWAMMLAGFLGVGCAMRRPRRVASVAA